MPSPNGPALAGWGAAGPGGACARELHAGAEPHCGPYCTALHPCFAASRPRCLPALSCLLVRCTHRVGSIPLAQSLTDLSPARQRSVCASPPPIAPGQRLETGSAARLSDSPSQWCLASAAAAPPGPVACKRLRTPYRQRACPCTRAEPSPEPQPPLLCPAPAGKRHARTQALAHAFAEPPSHPTGALRRWQCPR